MTLSSNLRWVTVWTSSAQGAYPLGSAIAQPDLQLAIPQPETGLTNQAFRMIVKPALESSTLRFRFSNVFGQKTLHLRDLQVGHHLGGGAMVPASCVEIADLDIEAGQWAWTHAVELKNIETHPVHRNPGRALVVSGWVEGESGPITWHAKAMATSYLSMPQVRVGHQDASEFKFPFSTTSLFFLDAVDAQLPEVCHATVALGDSLTDGTFTTLNGFDRWTDVLQRSLWVHGHAHAVVLNAGIGGNQVLRPSSLQEPWRGGPAAIERLDRDVLSLSGIKNVIWLEGINDFSDNGNAEVAALTTAMAQTVDRLRSAGIGVIGATLPSAFRSTRPGHGSPLQEEKRRALNQWILSGQVFDAVVDLDQVLSDPETGGLAARFDFDSTLGEPGDGLHPNRAGHAAIANAFLGVLTQ